MALGTEQRPTLVGTDRPETFTGVLPGRITRYRRPRWWQEIVIVLFGYWVYGLVRNAVPEHDAVALRHGRGVQHLQDALHLSFELPVNRWVAAHESVAQVLDYYYATLHFVVTATVLVWLFAAHKRVFRGARTALFAATIVALAGFWVFPLAPPRLLPQYGYVDTLVRFHTWGSLADPQIADRSNEYAAMPSLHIAWALWAGLSLWFCARRLWVRSLGLAHPVGTALVVIGTANHFLLDVIGGALAVAAGFVVQALMSGRRAYVAAPEVGGPAASVDGRPAASVA